MGDNESMLDKMADAINQIQVNLAKVKKYRLVVHPDSYGKVVKAIQEGSDITDVRGDFEEVIPGDIPIISRVVVVTPEKQIRKLAPNHAYLEEIFDPDIFAVGTDLIDDLEDINIVFSNDYDIDREQYRMDKPYQIW